MDDHSWSLRLGSEKLLDDVEGAEDVDLERRAEVLHLYIFAWNKRVACCGIGDQDIDRSDLLYNGGNMNQIRNGSGMCCDLDIGKSRLELLFRRI